MDPASDFSTLVAAPELAGVDTPGTMSQPVLVDDVGASQAFMQSIVADSAPASSPALPSLGERFKGALSSVQTAVAAPFQSLGQSAAKAVGASPQTASSVGAGLLPVLLVAAAVVVVVILVRNRTRTVKA